MPDNSSMTAIALVISRFNETITEKLHAGAMARLDACGVQPEAIDVFWVPGAIEIPLILQTLAKTGRYQAMVALGVVIQGETGHYDYVCQQVSQGTQHISLTYDVPIAFGILTTDTMAQALDRAGGKKGNKGADAVDAALLMYWLTQQIKERA